MFHHHTITKEKDHTHFISQPIYLSICLSKCLSIVRLLVNLSIYAIAVYRSTYLSMPLPSIGKPIYLCNCRLLVNLSIYAIAVYRSTYLSMPLPSIVLPIIYATAVYCSTYLSMLLSSTSLPIYLCNCRLSFYLFIYAIAVYWSTYLSMPLSSIYKYYHILAFYRGTPSTNNIYIMHQRNLNKTSKIKITV